MLVLSRKVGEAVVINGGQSGEVRIKFIRHGSNGCIKLGFEAGPNVRIHREEIEDEIRRQRGYQRNSSEGGCDEQQPAATSGE